LKKHWKENPEDFGVKIDTPADESIQRIKHLAGI